jgi:hypothetical protein
MRIVGWLCLVGVALVIYDLVTFLPWLPEHWWHPEQPPRVVGHGMQFDLRTMIVDFFGLGWIGSWGYIASFVWIPVAVSRFIRSRQQGRAALPSERIILVALCLLLVAVSLLVHLTPLHYADFNIPVL